MASDKLRGEMGKEEKEDEMDMSPMIDMVFLLLIFFIVVSTPMVVTQDPEVAPSVAYNSVDVDEKNGRIVINVREDGTFTKVDFKQIMTEPTEITEYVQEEIIRLTALGYEDKIKIHLRGDDDAKYKHSQTVIKACAEAGVDKIVFSVFPFEKK